MTDKTDLATQAALAVLPVFLTKAQVVTSCDDEQVRHCIELAIGVGEKFASAMTGKKPRRKKS